LRLRLSLAIAFTLTRLTVICFAQDAKPASDESPWQAFVSRLWLSGQINIIAQGHGRFPSPYSGPNSFRDTNELAVSRVFTIYTGLRLTNTTDIFFDPESTSGHDLSDGHGLAGFTNVDLVGVPNNHPYVARAILHQTVPLSSDSVEVDRGPLQLAGQVAARRFEFYVGKMSLTDFFDVNVVGSDSHFQFLNWTVDNNSTYGYPADSRGYTYAALAEYHDHAWTLRFAEALVSKLSNPNVLNADLAQSRSENIEWELHHKLIHGRDGTVRLLGFVDHGTFGDYRAANDAFKEGIDLTPDITAHRQPAQTKYGFGLNIEQEITPVLRAFGRFGWDEGHKESLAFTEANQAVSGGLDLQGKTWGRRDDKLGGAFVVNGLSADHREYLALGGLGILLGDGKLNYGREEIVEAYYTLKLWRGIYAAADLQRIWNPGYNRDRGGVLVAAVRLHLEGAILNSPR